MGSINAFNPNVDLTAQTFDEFYADGVNIDPNEYDLVNSFFMSVFKDPRAAKNFTLSLFKVAEQSRIPILTLLNELQGQSTIEMNATLCYYLNGLRSLTTLLGYNGAVVPNYWAARNVLL